MVQHDSGRGKVLAFQGIDPVVDAYGVEWMRLNGNTHEKDDFEGKLAYVLGFQASCPDCHKVGFPHLKKTMSRYEDNDDVRFRPLSRALR